MVLAKIFGLCEKQRHRKSFFICHGIVRVCLLSIICNCSTSEKKVVVDDGPLIEIKKGTL